MKAIHSILIILPIFISIQTYARSKIFGLENLDPDKDVISGCSCSVMNSNKEFLVSSDLQEKAPAIVRINGQKMELKWISSSKKMENPKKDETFNRVYGDANIKLKLTYKTRFICGKDDDSCEVTRYSVDSVLEDGKKKSKLKNLEGDCGC